MAGSDKITRRVDSGRNTAESSKSVSETASGKTAKQSLKEQDAEWGFEPSKSGMAAEAKMGMAIVVILVCAFGFLVYHKFDLKQRALLQAQMKAAAEGPAELANASTTADAKANALSEFYSETPSEQADPTDAFEAAALNQVSSVTDPVADFSASVPTRESREFTSASAPIGQKPQFDMEEPSLASPEPVDEMPAFSGTVAASSSASLSELASDPFGRFDRESTTPQGGNTVTPDESPSPMVELDQPSKLAPAKSTTAVAESTHSLFEDASGADSSKPEPFPSFDEPEVASTKAANTVAATPDRDLLPATSLTAPEADPFSPFEENPEDTLAATQEPSATLLPELDDPIPIASTSQPEFEGDSLSAGDEPESTNLNSAKQSPTRDEVTATKPEPEFQKFTNETPTPKSSSSTLIAMLEPAPDVNLFDESDARPGSSSSSDFSTPKSAVTSKPSPFEPKEAPTQHFDRKAVVEDQVPEPRPLGNSFPETTFEKHTPNVPADRPSLFPEEPPTIAQPQMTLPSASSIVPDSVAKEEFGVARFVDAPAIKQVAGTVHSEEVFVVRPKDTYWTISKRVYGTARYFSSLALYNKHRIPDPKKLRSGMKVLVPQPEVLESKYPELFRDYQRKPKQAAGYFVRADGSPAYRVGDRETLSEISQKHLGRASRWIQIYHLNRNILKDPNKLKPGSVIVLPDDATDLHLTP